MATSSHHWYLFLISLRCLEPVRLTKNLAQNRNISIHSSFEHRILVFLNALTLNMKIYIKNALLNFKSFL